MNIRPLFQGSALLCLFSLTVFAQAPTSLTVKAATSKKVDLTWTGTATSYNVQRRALGGTFSTISTVNNATAASDTTIDAFTTYQYQIVAASGSTTPSNTVTVGPPPAGFSVLAPAPGAPGSELANNYGYDVTTTLDGNGDPAVAFIFDDPNADSDHTDTQLIFRSWSRAQYKWNPDNKVGVVGDVATGFRYVTSLAYDSSTGILGLASEFASGDSEDIRLYLSTDGGTSWTTKTTFHVDGDGLHGPSLALANGNIYLAYGDDPDGIKYVTGQLSADPKTWTTKTNPTVNGQDPDENTAPSLALDSNGIPAIAYFAYADNYNAIANYWRPSGNTPPVKAIDSQNTQSDSVAVRLKFFGTQPRLIAELQRKDADFGVGVHFVRSQDGGATWLTPVVIPPDGNSSSDFPFDLALDSQGHGAIAFGQNSGSGDEVCGRPKVSLSTDLVTWKTCNVGSLDATQNFDVYPTSINVAYGNNDKLYLMWTQEDPNPTGYGILMYREPPAGSNSTPSLDTGSLVNGATYLPNIVSGSWAQVTGQNLADVTRAWGDADFTGGESPGDPLPTTLSGVQVKVNNLPAAVYYISPTQVNFQTPTGVVGTANVQVIRSGAVSNTVSGPAVANAPGLFSYAIGGKNYPAALYANSYTVVGDPSLAGSAVRKAVVGDHIALYATAIASSPAGVIISPTGGLPGVTATVGGQPAAVEFAGLVAVGEYQVNIVVPQLNDGEYDVVIKYNGQSSQTGVKIPIGK